MDLVEELSRMSVIDIAIAGASAYAGYTFAQGSLDSLLAPSIGGAIVFRTALNAARGAIRAHQQEAPVLEHALFGARYAASRAIVYASTGLVFGLATEFGTSRF